MSDKVKRRKFIADLLFAGGTLTAGAFIAKYATDDGHTPQKLVGSESPEKCGLKDESCQPSECEPREQECEPKPYECGPEKLTECEPEKNPKPGKPQIVDRDPFNNPKIAGNVAMPQGHEPNVAGGMRMPTERRTLKKIPKY